MSKTLLAIHSHGKARAFVWSLWPSFKIPGWDILGIHAQDEPHDWPENTPSIALGKGGRQLPHDHLVRRFVDTFRVFMRPEYSSYDDFFLTEYDSMFTKPPPPHPGGLFACRAGGTMPGFKCSVFFHPPWWADRATAATIVSTGEKLIAAGETEQGSTDCFLGLLVDRSGIKWTNTDTLTCQNGGDGSDMDGYLAPRIESFLNAHPQNWFVHGVKTQSNVNLIKRLSK
jgi:hypothetical protein